MLPVAVCHVCVLLLAAAECKASGGLRQTARQTVRFATRLFALIALALDTYVARDTKALGLSGCNWDDR